MYVSRCCESVVLCCVVLKVACSGSPLWLAANESLMTDQDTHRHTTREFWRCASSERGCVRAFAHFSEQPLESGRGPRPFQQICWPGRRMFDGDFLACEWVWFPEEGPCHAEGPCQRRSAPNQSSLLEGPWLHPRCARPVQRVGRGLHRLRVDTQKAKAASRFSVLFRWRGTKIVRQQIKINGRGRERFVEPSLPSRFLIRSPMCLGCGGRDIFRARSWKEGHTKSKKAPERRLVCRLASHKGAGTASGGGCPDSRGRL